MPELREILEGCKRNERKYQDMLYKRFSRLLYGVSLRYTNSQEEAEDVLQEGWVKIFKNVSSYSLDNSFEGWIRRIMINTAITHYRKNLKHAYQEDVTDDAYAKFDSVNPGDSEFTQEELMKAINSLPPGYKLVFNMYVVEGFKHKEIAEQLNIDINTSKSQLSRAKKFLQRELLEMSAIKL
jgi:RNA polymerase sigma factor (sigma-70 family)